MKYVMPLFLKDWKFKSLHISGNPSDIHVHKNVAIYYLFLLDNY